ncbi:MAG: biotin/lipoyl-containing protein, partial [Bacteroidota bacterium]|nr:biotin/lipoyl-containing protein [Bacteroidota bacterium]
MPILEMKVPSPGESISEVEIATWLVSDGDYVEKDQAIAEVDSDKATLELPAEAAGVITLKAEEGDAVAVGDVCCLIDTDAERPAGAAALAPKLEAAPVPAAAPAATPASAPVAPAPAPAPAAPASTGASHAAGHASPAARKSMADAGLPAGSI